MTFKHLPLDETNRFLATIEIPHHRWWSKFRKSIFGLGVLGLAIFFKRQGWFPDSWLGAMIFLAGFCLAGDILRNFGGFLRAFAKDAAEAIRTVRAAFKNGG